MPYAPTDIHQFAAMHETSDVIVLAIFEIAFEGDEERVWADPDDAEFRAVSKRAWELADSDEDTLHWGSVTLLKPR